MASDRAARLHQMYAAFNRRDVEQVLASMVAEVRWPNGWEGGYVQGHAAVRDYWRRQWAQIDPSVTPQEVAALPDGRLAVAVRQVIRNLAGDILSDQVVTHTYSFVGDLIATMEIESPA